MVAAFVFYWLVGSQVFAAGLPAVAGVAEINRALYLGISGEDVRVLQEFLAKDKNV